MINKTTITAIRTFLFPRIFFIYAQLYSIKKQNLLVLYFTNAKI